MRPPPITIYVSYRYNPIELVFSQLKANFKALRAKKLMGLIQDSHEMLVTRAVHQLKKANILKCVDHT